MPLESREKRRASSAWVSHLHHLHHHYD